MRVKSLRDSSITAEPLSGATSKVLWTSSATLLAADTVRIWASRGGSPETGVLSQWGLYLSAAAAAWSVCSSVRGATSRVVKVINIGDGGAERDGATEARRQNMHLVRQR